MNRAIFISLWSLFLIACTSVSPLEQALQLSGDNRVHLEQVLRHYSQHPADSLKYKAACFLIENMPGHGWYEGKELDKYQKWLDSVYYDKDFVYKLVLYEAFFQQPDATDDLTKYEDIHQIDSNFLITHIDSTFSAVSRRPWLNTLSFEQLCEYILPYRGGHERPQLLFRLQDSLFKTDIEDWLNYDNIRENTTNLFTYSQITKDRPKRWALIQYQGETKAYDTWGCIPLAIADLWKARLLLCPVAIDLNPAFPNQNNRHCWSAMVDNTQTNGIKPISFEVNKSGKIYRNTFSHQPHPLPKTQEFIPPFFKSPFYKDVTSLYTPVKDITINPVIPINTDYGYLCVFNDLKWEPVACAEYENGQFKFKNAGCGVVYLPVIYPDEQEVAIAHPFILDWDGRITTLEPDTTNLIHLKLTRKYPLRHTVKSVNQKFRNAVIEASNDPHFKQKDSLGTFGKVSSRQFASAKINSIRKYQYWRIRSSAYFALGECFLYDTNGHKVTPDTKKQSQQEPDETAFDDDPVSYAHSSREGIFTFDMGRALALSRIECLLRNDGNQVWPGHWYELNYYSQGGWYSLGVKEARERFVEFGNIPANSLLWLRDLTTGKEERIFTYKDAQIRFW